MVDELRLPRAEHAVIPRRKLTHYALDPSQPRGRHKARVFRSVLGISTEHWRHLCEQIRMGVGDGTASRARVTPYGQAYKVVIPVTGINGVTAPVATTWIVLGDGPPRLTSLWVDVP